MLCRRHFDAPGFTLVEVLVALLVLALALVALQLRMSSYLDDAAYLRDRTLASWVALNQVELLHIARRLELPRPAVDSNGSVRLGGRDWYWHLRRDSAAASEAGDVAQLWRVQVSPEDPETARSNPLANLVTVQEPDLER